MSTPKVSIILPNHNYADFIPDAIASIKAQTLPDWECIIIDDASTDNSVDVIKNLIQGDNRFKLFVNSESLGVSAARNVGLDAAKGEYITFLDSDDCYMEYFLEMLVALSKNTGSDIAGAMTGFVGPYFKYKPSNIKWNTDNYVIFDNPLDMEKAPEKRKWIWIWRRIYKRELLKDVRFHNEMKINGDDITFMLDLLYRVPKVVESNIDGVYHRVHPVSITSRHQKFNLERVEMFPRLFKYMRENLLDKYDKPFLDLLYKNLFLYMLSECFIKHSSSLTEQNKEDLRDLLSRACKLIVKEHLPEEHQLLCEYLICQK